MKKLSICLASTVLLSACAVGPDYQKPTSASAPEFKELAGWKLAAPQDEKLSSKWWEVYGDPVLNQLMEKVNINNQNILVAEAQYRQASALVQAANAGLFPTLGASASAVRSSGTTSSLGAVNQNASTGLSASWEPDIWGGIRRNIEANKSAAEASSADLEAARLSARATLAVSYFQLRVTDMQKRMLEDTVKAYRKSLELTQNQYTAGIAKQLDIAQAQTLLKSTEALAIDTAVTRAQLEHAIAVLIGQTPSSFSLAPQELTIDPNSGLIAGPASQLVAKLPGVPVGLPTSLLERRPDIAGAERRMASANANIGVAKAAFFPNLTLSATGGYASNVLPGLLSAPNQVWSLGPAIAGTLFDGGARSAASSRAVAGYDQSVATYRQTVLAAFQDVEDNLVALRLLEDETAAQEAAVKYARNSVAMTMNQYKAGLVSYLSVVTVQATELTNERTLMTLMNRRLAAHVGLIRSLGGGWDASLARID